MPMTRPAATSGDRSTVSPSAASSSNSSTPAMPVNRITIDHGTASHIQADLSPSFPIGSDRSAFHPLIAATIAAHGQHDIGNGAQRHEDERHGRILGWKRCLAQRTWLIERFAASCLAFRTFEAAVKTRFSRCIAA